MLDCLHVDSDQVCVWIDVIQHLLFGPLSKHLDIHGFLTLNLALYHQLALLGSESTLEEVDLMVSRHRLDTLKAVLFEKCSELLKLEKFLLS